MRQILCAALVCSLPLVAVADGSSPGARRAVTGAERVGADAAVADPRLPPVFPGEEVRDGDKIIKMWSTSGSVTVNPPPEAPRAPSHGGAVANAGVGVIVDARRGRPREVDSGADFRAPVESAPSQE